MAVKRRWRQSSDSVAEVEGEDTQDSVANNSQSSAITVLDAANRGDGLDMLEEAVAPLEDVDEAQDSPVLPAQVAERAETAEEERSELINI